MKLIDKSALVAWAKETYLCENASMIRKVCYKQLLEHLNTLEVKEVDLEEEIQRQYNVHKNPNNSIVKDCVIMTKDGFEYFAKHFFELGMQQSKNYNNNEE